MKFKKTTLSNGLRIITIREVDDMAERRFFFEVQFERFVIICTSLARDFLPSSWGYISPTVVDIFTFFGTFGVFSVLFLLFIRFLPIMAIAEIKAVTPQADPHAGSDHH